MQFNVNGFWDESSSAIAAFGAPPFDDTVVAVAERELGYKLPQAYLDLLRGRNGGYLQRRRFLTENQSIELDITYICGIGGPFGIINDDDTGSSYMIAEWGYPDIGIAIAYTESGGHEVVMLDYTLCGPIGEPAVIYVDTETDTGAIIPLADNFSKFLALLQN